MADLVTSANFGLRSLAREPLAGYAGRIISPTNIPFFTGSSSSYLLTGPSLPAGLTFTRASAAIGPSGLGTLTSVTTNTPRFAKDPLTGATLGMLLEPAVTNLVTDGDDLTGASVSNITPTLTTGMLGANTATRLTATADNATLSIPITSSSPYHTVQLECKRVAGIGAVDLSLDNGATWSTISPQMLPEVSGNDTDGWTSTAKWVKCYWTQYSTDPTIKIRISEDGDQIAVCGVACVAGVFPTSYVAGGATRAIETLTLPIFGALTWADIIAIDPWVEVYGYSIISRIDDGDEPVVYFPAQASPIGSRFPLPARTVTITASSEWSTLYFRQGASDFGTGTGADYTNALGTNSTAGRAAIASTNKTIIKLCDEHLPAGTGVATFDLPIKSHKIIRGDDPTHPCTMWGGSVYTMTWTDAGVGTDGGGGHIYTSTLPWSWGPDGQCQAMYYKDGTARPRLIQTLTEAEMAANESTFWLAATGAGSVIKAHLPSGKTAQGNIILPTYGYHFVFDPTSGARVENIAMVGMQYYPLRRMWGEPSSGSPRFQPRNFVFRAMNFQQGGAYLFEGQGTKNLTWITCNLYTLGATGAIYPSYQAFDEAGVAVSFDDAALDANITSGYRVFNTRIGGVQSNPFKPKSDTDGHGIGFKGSGFDQLIYGNTIRDCVKQLVFFNMSSANSNFVGNEAKWNSLGGNSEGGNSPSTQELFQIGISNGNGSGVYEFEVWYNEFDAPTPFASLTVMPKSFRGGAPSTNPGSGCTVRGNVFRDVPIGPLAVQGFPMMEARMNTVTRPSNFATPYFAGINISLLAAETTFDYNTYILDGVSLDEANYFLNSYSTGSPISKTDWQGTYHYDLHSTFPSVGSFDYFTVGSDRLVAGAGNYLGVAA